MSKIFEALTKAGGKGKDPALAVLQQQTPVGDSNHVAEPAIAAAPEPPTAPKTAPKGDQPVLHVPKVGHILANAPALPFDGTQAQAAEQYRIIRTKLAQHPKQPRRIMVSSPGPRDGKSITALNLAGALALKSDVNVLLVDVDFRRSSLGSVLGIPNRVGLANVLMGECALSDALIRLEQFPNLYFLPVGHVEANAAELLDLPVWKSLCDLFGREFRYTLLDSPPIESVADYDLIQSACDGVVVVVRPDHSNRARCLGVLRTLPKDKLLGVVINCVKPWFLWRKRDYYYQYREQDPDLLRPAKTSDERSYSHAGSIVRGRSAMEPRPCDVLVATAAAPEEVSVQRSAVSAVGEQTGSRLVD